MAVNLKTTIFVSFLCSVAALELCVSSGGSTPRAIGQEKPPAEKPLQHPAGAVEIRFVDGSTMKLLLCETKIELETDYGKLFIPVADIQRIEFGLRISEATRRKIEKAINDLASADFRHRQAATADLLALKEKAYPALQRAANGKDGEVSRRAQAIVDKIREAQPADEQLDLPSEDVIHTARSKVTGNIKLESFRVLTLPFGEQQAKLADMRRLQSQNAQPEERPVAAGEVLPDLGSVRMFGNEVGKTLAVRVTAPQPGDPQLMSVFGTDVYTVDSSLAGAAVHAGVLRPGQTGVVRITLIGPHPNFPSSLRNGVMSQPWGAWNGFRIERPKGAAR